MIKKNRKGRKISDPTLQKIKYYFDTIKDDANTIILWKRYFENDKKIFNSNKWYGFRQNQELLNTLMPDKELQRNIIAYSKYFIDWLKKY